MAGESAKEEVPGSSAPAQESAEKWNSKYQQARVARLKFEQRWFTNLAFVAGRQYVTWDTSATTLQTGRMIEPANMNNRVRLVINKTRRIMRRELAKINKEQIRGYVTPSTSDDDSQAAARGAEQVADYLTEQLKLQWRFKQADWWMLICGTSFLKTYYDEQVQMGYVEQTDLTGQKQMVPVYGSPTVEPVSPFHILVPNLDEPDLQKQPWVMHVTMKDPSWVKAVYGVDVSNEQTSVSTNSIESRLMNIQGMTTDAQKNKAVEIREIWIRPSAEYPEGAYVVCTQGKVIANESAFPYEHGMYPFAKRTYIENSIFYGVTLVEDLIPLQVEYNRTRSAIVEDHNRMGRPMLAVEMGSLDVKKLRGVAGDVITYRTGSKPPQPIQLSGLPSYILDHVNRIAGEMAELASQENSDGTTVPNGVTAATAIAYLQENQDALIMDTLRDKEMAWEDVIQQCLALVGQFWDSQRLITVSGENNAFETFRFSQSDMKGQTDWRAVVGSATPMSYSAKQAQIMELMKMQFIPPTEGLQFLELGDTARLYENMQIDLREAQKENLRIRNMVWMGVELYQDHLQHIMAHDNVRKREEYESWDDQAKAMMMYHVALHMFQFLSEHGQMVQFPPGPDGQPMNPFMAPVQPGMQQQIPVIPQQVDAALRMQMNMLMMTPAAPQPTAAPPTTPGSTNA